MGCNDEPCFEVRGRIRTFDQDVEILSIRRTTLNWSTNQGIPGSELDVAPGEIDQPLLDAIRSLVGGPSGFLVQAPDCPDGCYCHILPDTRLRNVSLQKDIYEVEFTYLTMRKVRGRPPELYDDEGGRRVMPTEADHLGPRIGLDRHGKLFPLYTRYDAAVKLKIWAEIFERHGRCAALPPFSEDREFV